MLNNIYLCVKHDYEMIYNCKSFESFQQADKYYREKYDKKYILSSSLIPVCKFNPLQELTLWYKLSKKQFVNLID